MGFYIDIPVIETQGLWATAMVSRQDIALR